jgi:peptide/nickel transport system ATP-binding protein
VLRRHLSMSGADARDRTMELLELVGIPAPARRVGEYPHQLSGGMRQRVMIAMALACDPKLLIADEPTTALDVTIQAGILDLLRDVRERLGTAIVLITHDLGVVADIADRALVMYGGRVVEQGTLDDIFYDPQHPYTWGLLGSITRIDRARPARLPAIAGLPPSMLNAPEGCHFRPRCPHEFDKCPQVPGLEQRVERPGHLDRCWLPVDRKKELRMVDGQIGLGKTEEVTP